MPLSRRKFFFLTGASAAGTVLASAPLKKLYAKDLLSQATKVEGFGPLRKDPNGLLDLPPGFQYRAFSRTGDRMNDGNLVPTDHDGMASFDAGGRRIALVRNHELEPDEPFEGNPQPKYDPEATGGTVTLVVDANNRKLIEHYASLSGTVRNCAGGPIFKNSSSPQKGSWLTCEETTLVTSNRRHGFVFEVPSDAKGVVDPIPLKGMGRFSHEAVAEDPESNYIYETEDDGPGSLFYRFRPNSVGDLRKGGVLEALRIKEMPQVNTSNNPQQTQQTFPLNQPMKVDWVEIPNPNPGENETPTQVQGFELGAAQFYRGEGCWYGKDENGEPQIVFTATDAGPNEKGQIWRFRPQQQTIELLAEPRDKALLESPDNITIAPDGTLYICEDGDGTDRLIGLTPEGNFFEFARNALNDAEMAGVNFSPDGRTMFLNSPQSNPGVTLAIWGPFEKLNRNRRS